MKKLIQAALIVVVVFMMLQAAVGGVFITVDETASLGNTQYVTAPASGQRLQVLICLSGRLVRCVMPNVGWNS
jgi:hypothetical protein